MNWDFFDDWADIPVSERSDILTKLHHSSGAFNQMVLSIPDRKDMDRIKAAVEARRNSTGV